MVTREDYLEMGSSACRRKWKGPHSAVAVKEVSKGKARLQESDGDDSDDVSDDERPAKRAGRGRRRSIATRKK